MATTVTSRRRQLGNEIRHAREAAGMTQHEVAELLGCGQAKVNKIESGAVSVKLADIRAMLDAFGLDGAEADALLDLARVSNDNRGQWSGHRSAVPHWFRAFTDLEPAASEILSWHGERIPGPLQSEHYMLKQFVDARAMDVADLIRNRQERRKVFDLKRPPYYRFILGEGALVRMPGGPNPAVALDLMQNLLDIQRQYRKVFVHILPFDAKLPFTPNDFTVMRFGDATKDMVFIEHVAGGTYIETEADFELYVDAWDRLRGAALEVDETVSFLEKLVEQARTQVQAQI